MMNNESYVRELAEAGPRLQPLLARHVEYFGELLPHVFMGEVSRFAIAEFAKGGGGRGYPDLIPLLAALEQGFLQGGEEVRELISVSFLENVAGKVAVSPEFLSLFGPELRLEIQVYLDEELRAGPRQTVECEVCRAATVRLLRHEGEVGVWACGSCGDLKRWCPRCDQGWIRRLHDPTDGEDLFSCDECDATWPLEGPIAGIGEDLQTYLRQALKPWSYMRLIQMRETEP